MLKDFYRDLQAAKPAEALVLKLALAAGYNAQDVSNNPDCYYKGDILITLPTGQEIYVEVKNDSVIHKTQNILCEEENYIKDGDYYKKGGMYNSGDYYVIVSQIERKLYVLDYKVLRSIYKKGTLNNKEFSTNISYFYLLELYQAKRYGALLDIINY